MKNVFKLLTFLFFNLIFIVSCSDNCCGYEDTSSANGSSGGGAEVSGAPGAATLISPPLNNSCESATVVDGFYSKVSFSWTKTSETDTYNLTYTDLSNNDTKTKTSISTNSTEIQLARGKAYAWSVQSINSNSKRGPKSSTSKFYLQGTPKYNNVPLAAVLSNPSVSGGDITFTWTGNDPDLGDSLSYTLYVDKVDGKQSPVKTGLSTNTAQLSLDTGAIYYWRIKSTDQNNNSSFSLISKLNI
jgi:hypothetical protein